jgi:hypothetical protein
LHDLEKKVKVKLTFWSGLPKELRSEIFIPGKKVYVCAGSKAGLEKNRECV